MGARYPYYLLADSPDGQRKEAEITRKAPSDAPTRGDVRQGFVYERVPHITLKSIANNAEIDVIWERWQETLEPLRDDLNARLDGDWEEWQIPREASEEWPAEAVETHRLWWEARIARQEEIDASIAARADYEYLYDKPCEDNRKVRVAGPFTVESLSPHRVLAVDEEDELIDRAAEPRADYGPQQDFAAMILEQLATAGLQQAHKEDRIAFAAVTHWPGDYICAEGRYREGEGDSGPEQRAGIFVGPEFGTVARPDLVAAAREAGDAGFDVLIACAFNYEAHASEFNRLGRIPVLKARMNADLHMADELKNTGKGNLVRHLRRAGTSTSSRPTEKTPAARGSRCGSTAWTSSTRPPARSVATAPTASPAGSSTPTTTRRASSSATPTSSARTTPTRRSGRR